MIVTMSELKCREVINICDGCRIGFVSDLELDCTGGNVVAIVFPPLSCPATPIISLPDLSAPWQKSLGVCGTPSMQSL